jgi:hypothetical protein
MRTNRHRHICRWVAGSLLAALASVASAWSAGPLPDARHTPGAINTAVGQGNIESTICVRGWTRTVRPSYEWSNSMKHRLLRQEGLPSSMIHAYELDHLVPLELGGAPADPRNLWLQPWNGGWSAHAKDDLENQLNHLVCSHRLSLAEAQRAIATDWISAYRKYVTSGARGRRY